MIRNISYRETGQTIVEFGLVAILLFMILFGIFDLGRVVFYYSSLSNAAREGARYAIVNPEDAAGIGDVICKYSTGVNLGCPNPPTTVCGQALDTPVACPNPKTPTVTIALEPHAVTQDDYIQVHLIYTFTPVTPLVALFLNDGQIVLDVETTMRIEG